MRTEDLVFLGANTSPSIEVLTADGRRSPLVIPTDGPFDSGMLRLGYVIVRCGYTPLVIADGAVLPSAALPDCWEMVPAVDPACVLVTRYFGRSTKDGEAGSVAQVDGNGSVLRSVDAHVNGIVGQLHDGVLVARNCYFDWAGVVTPFPIRGEAISVTGGRYVTIADGTTVTVVDTQSDQITSITLSRQQSWYTPAYDSHATRAAHCLGTDGILVIVDEQPKLLDVSLEYSSALWLNNGDLLVASYGDAPIVVNVAAGTVTSSGLSKKAIPRLDVTGRINFDVAAALHTPPRVGPITASERQVILGTKRALISEACSKNGIDKEVLMAAITPMIQLRTVPVIKAPKVGTSHFGGRPDLPKGISWPTHDGTPMAFLAQLRCDELAAALPDRDLPTSGWFAVFVALEADGMSADDESGIALLHIPETALKRSPYPKGLADELRFEAVAVSVEPGLSIPDWSGLDELLGDDETTALLGTLAMPSPDHRMFGHRSSAQGFAIDEGCELFLQLDSDAILDVGFADGGRLHIMKPLNKNVVTCLDELTVETDSH
jgi:Domain of unknown function (DUF1963)